MFLTKLLLCAFITNYFTSSFIKIKIINTRILINLPSPRLHEIVILESYDTKEKVAIDFTPIRNRFTTFSLLFGRNVPGEIRIRRIPEYISIKNSDELLSSLIIKDNFKTISITNDTESSIQTLQIRSQMLNDFVKKAVLYDDFIKNNYTMNLYKRNCRHFCSHVKLLYKTLN
jgi:hypothetical protein